ncbi:UDP-N-acetylglucosamine 1-carboxyvinyltransferase [bacterium]|nr:UDP-N-acetylglucosamine 1-carboxyvinyltransferase [bacterium]
MDKIIIDGPCPLKGKVKVSGAKNATLPIMAACLLSPSKFVLRNIPSVVDAHTMIKLLSALGAKTEWLSKDTISIDSTNANKWKAPYQIVSKMRASICVLGPLMARFKKAEVSYPGGCVIGTRPIDLHLKGLTKLGANIELKDGYVVAKAKELNGASIYLAGAYGSTVLGTANILMASTLAKGETIIEGAACEPEVVDLGNFLIKMGAKIKGLGSPTITVTGVKKLHGAEHTIISDRIEAGTYLIGGIISRGEVEVEDINPKFLTVFIDKLIECGVEVKQTANSIKVKAKKNLKPIEITTLPYPGFPTDLQAQMTAFLTTIEGISFIHEKIYPDRFMHIAELLRMGARIIKQDSTTIIQGGKLKGAPVMASDLRASAALVLAGLAAEGRTEVNRVYHIDRGYPKIDEKLASLGAKIKRVQA